MKKFYAAAGVKTARYHIVSTFEEGKKFTDVVGFPVVVKPNNGVGAAATYKLRDENEMHFFYDHLGYEEYIMGEFINGELLLMME